MQMTQSKSRTRRNFLKAGLSAAAFPFIMTGCGRTSDIRKSVGQLLQIGLNGNKLTSDQIRLLRTYPPGSIRVTPYITKFIPQKMGPASGAVSNVELAKTYEQVTAIVYESCGIAPIIRSGLEGGEMHALLQDRYPVPPRYMGFSNHDIPAFTRKAFLKMAQDAKSIGVACGDVMVDVNFDRRNPAMNVRTFGGSVDLIVRHAHEVLEAMRESRTIPVIKHFPSQSWGDVDTHEDRMVINMTKEELEATALFPYRKLLKNDMMIMLSHAVAPALDPDFPTTLSRRTISGFLRGELRFNGVVMTDSITMGAISKYHSVPDACVLAIKAGADQILLKADDDFETCITALETAVRKGILSEERIQESLERLRVLKGHYGLAEPFKASPDLIESRLHSPESQGFWKSVADTVTRAVRVHPEDLPLRPVAGEKWLVLESDESILGVYCKDEWNHAGALADSLRARFPSVHVEFRQTPYCEKAEEAAQFIEGAEKFQRVFVGAYSRRPQHSPLGVSLSLEKRKIPHIGLVNNIFNADPGRLAPAARTVICPFSFFHPAIGSAVAMLAGDIPLNTGIRSDLALNGPEAWKA